MDASKEYIKMCEKAVEIQALKPTEFGWIMSNRKTGFCYTDEDNVFTSHEHICNSSGEIIAHEFGTWLPRQDQLQEMCGCVECDLQSFEWFYYNNHYEGGTWEKFWVCFVMYKLHNKTWNGEDWQLLKT